jgi:hypothetical protein
MDKKSLMEFGLRALREQVVAGTTPKIPQKRPTAGPDYTALSNMKGFMARRQMHGKPYIK